MYERELKHPLDQTIQILPLYTTGFIHSSHQNVWWYRQLRYMGTVDHDQLFACWSVLQRNRHDETTKPTINFMIYLWNRYTVHLLPIFTYNYHFHKLPGRQQALASPMKSCLLLFHEISSHAVRWNLVMQNRTRVQRVCLRAKNSTI